LAIRGSVELGAYIGEIGVFISYENDLLNSFREDSLL
jgi:hypothetical protein